MKPPNHGCRVCVTDLEEFPYKGYLAYCPTARQEGVQGLFLIESAITPTIPLAIWTTDRITLTDEAYNGSSPLNTEGSR